MDETISAPDGWVSGSHCGYLAFFKGDWVVYEFKKRDKPMWVRALIFKGDKVPTSVSTYLTLEDALKGQ